MFGHGEVARLHPQGDWLADASLIAQQCPQLEVGGRWRIGQGDDQLEFVHARRECQLPVSVELVNRQVHDREGT